MKTERLADDVTLYCGDCRAVMAQIGRVDAVLTDPPYGVLNLGGQTSAVRKSRRVNNGALTGRALFRDSTAWDVAPDRAFFDHLRAMSGQQIIWGGNYFDLPPTREILIWDKCQPWDNFSQAEIAWSSGNRPAAIFRIAATRLRAKEHPTQKPIELMRWCVDRLVGARLIFDPFMGSGTTGVASIAAGRGFLGVEISPQYFDAACRRIEAALRAAGR